MRRRVLLVVAIVVVVVLGGATAVMTQPGGLRSGPRTVVAHLRGYDEVPAISSAGEGRFTATLNEAGTALTYQLGYFNIEGNVTQAHLHFGQRGVNGGIVVFLCTNLGNGPAGTQACPAPPATVGGTLMAGDVINGAGAQGIAAGEFPELLRAIRAGIAYANVHSDVWPGGEIRGQLEFNRD